jgi:hypothetical protein
MATFSCGNCPHSQDVDDVHIGKRTRCPRCGRAGKVVDADLSLDYEPSGAIAEMLAQDGNAITVERASGGSVRTRLSHGIVLNESSSLSREWTVINDPRMPVCLVGCTGVTTRWRPETQYKSSGYEYFAKYQINCREDVAAYQIRYLTFDVWGSHERTLIAAEISDIAANENRKDEACWELYSENEASEFHASIAYVSKVRTAAGKVWEANTEPVMREVHRFNAKLMESDLEPVKVKR